MITPPIEESSSPAIVNKLRVSDGLQPRGRQSPVRDQLFAAKYTQHGVGIADIDG
jgi:hypothetical protein